MKREEFLRLITKQIQYVFDRKDIEEELNQHIEDSILDMIDDGIQYLEAEKIAIQQMGDPKEIGKQLNKEHNPVIGYLLLLSKIVICLLIIPMILIGIILVRDMYYVLTPTTVSGAETILKIHEQVDIPTHRIMIDNLCYKDDTYYLTYRSLKNFGYSRTGWDTDSFEIVDVTGEFLMGSSFRDSNLFGGAGYAIFKMPEDRILYLRFQNEKIVVIDLLEYGDE